MKQMTIFALCLALFAAAPAFAGKKNQDKPIDMGAYTCEKFLKEAAEADAESVGMILMWIDGYLSGVSGDTELDFKEFGIFSENLAKYCSTHGEANLLEAAKKKGIE